MKILKKAITTIKNKLNFQFIIRALKIWNLVFIKNLITYILDFYVKATKKLKNYLYNRPLIYFT